MSIYGIEIIALTEILDDWFRVQKGYANDGNAVGSHNNVEKFLTPWKVVSEYHLTKCHIVTTEHLFEESQKILVQNEVNKIGSFRALGSVIG